MDYRKYSWWLNVWIVSLLWIITNHCDSKKHGTFSSITKANNGYIFIVVKRDHILRRFWWNHKDCREEEGELFEVVKTMTMTLTMGTSPQASIGLTSSFSTSAGCLRQNKTLVKMRTGASPHFIWNHNWCPCDERLQTKISEFQN